MTGKGRALPETWFSSRPLRFRCTKCGACCRRPGWVFVQPMEARAIAERLAGPDATPASLAPDLWQQDESGAWAMLVEDGEACPLLGPDGCTVHDIKPIQCATYPFWPEVLGTEEDWSAEAWWCEGLRPEHTLTEEAVYAPERVFDILAECSRTSENE